jgi:hypothetical protein
VAFARDIRPWLGREAALALLNTSAATAGSELVLDVSRTGAARAFVARAGATAVGAYRGIELYRYRSGTVLAFVGHYLALGQDASVHAAIDAAQGQVPSLQASPEYQRAAAGEPADRVLDAYVSAAGLQRILIPRGGLVGALGALLAQPALTGATVSLSATAAAAKVRVHSALEDRPQPAAPSSAFSPTLDQLLPARSQLLFDTRSLVRTAPRVLSAGATAGIAGRIGPLLRRLGGALAAEGVDVARVESIFSGETAVAIGPRRALIVVTRTADEQTSRTELANLEIPLAQLFPAPSSGSGLEPQLSDRTIAGVTAHRVSLAPGLELDYAVAHGLVIVSTSLEGIAEVVDHARSLASESAYQATLSGRPDQVTSVLFLDFSQLLKLAEQTGLLRGAHYQALRVDIERIRAVGLNSTSGEAESTAELTFQIP